MADIRVVKLAKLLVNYSMGIKKDDYLLIEASDLAQPLVKEVYREAIRNGAHVNVNITIPGLTEIFFKEASEEQLQHVSKYHEWWVDAYDAVLSIWGGHNEKALSSVDPKRRQMRSKALRDINIRFMTRMDDDLRWCGTQFPTHASAQEGSMSLEEYEDFVYGAGLLDFEDPVAEWKKFSAEQDRICQYLDTKKTLHIVSKDTDLKMSIAGRKWINCDGKANFPDGEVFTGPVEDSVEGHIRFSFPAIYGGKEVEDIRLEFKAGKVVNATAAKGEDLLHALLDTDEGSRILGEIAIGTNYGIQTFTKNILFDEKIGGTVHAAIGNAYPESGGKNQSGIHWDMIADMKDGGEIYADGELFYKDGKFLI